jgi:hypothetical protein
VLAQAGDGGGGLGELAGVLKVDREEAVVAGARPDLDREPRAPDRHPLPHWPGKELDPVDGVVLAVVVHALTRPGSGEDL